MLLAAVTDKGIPWDVMHLPNHTKAMVIQADGIPSQVFNLIVPSSSFHNRTEAWNVELLCSYSHLTAPISKPPMLFYIERTSFF
jgi:hypothetical protein